MRIGRKEGGAIERFIVKTSHKWRKESVTISRKKKTGIRVVTVNTFVIVIIAIALFGEGGQMERD